jgi:hypothetical protein
VLTHKRISKMVQHRCRNDGMRIPQVAEVLEKGEPVRFYWCWSCEELSAYVGDPPRLAVRFAEDGCGGWWVFHAPGAECDIQAALSAVSRVHPDRAKWECQSPRSPAWEKRPTWRATVLCPHCKGLVTLILGQVERCPACDVALQVREVGKSMEDEALQHLLCSVKIVERVGDAPRRPVSPSSSPKKRPWWKFWS